MLGFEGSAEAGSLGMREGVGEERGCGPFPEKEGGQLEKRDLTGGVRLAGIEGERVAGPFPLGCCWVVWLRASPVRLVSLFFVLILFYFQFCLIDFFVINLFGFGLNFNFVNFGNYAKVFVKPIVCCLVKFENKTFV
jgi:hypothetical protein